MRATHANGQVTGIERDRSWGEEPHAPHGRGQGPPVVPYCFGDTVGDGAVTNRVTMVQTAKKTSPNAWQVHLLDLRAALALVRVIGGIRCMQDQRDSFALGRVAFGCSARPKKCENCDHFAGPCDPGFQPNRAPRPALFGRHQMCVTKVSRPLARGSTVYYKQIYQVYCLLLSTRVPYFAFASPVATRRICFIKPRCRKFLSPGGPQYFKYVSLAC
jgi:hypothetical protein